MRLMAIMNWKSIKSYLLITLGTVLMAVGVYFFEFTNNFSTGGTSGLALVISEMPSIWDSMGPTCAVSPSML